MLKLVFMFTVIQHQFGGNKLKVCWVSDIVLPNFHLLQQTLPFTSSPHSSGHFTLSSVDTAMKLLYYMSKLSVVSQYWVCPCSYRADHQKNLSMVSVCILRTCGVHVDVTLPHSGWGKSTFLTTIKIIAVSIMLATGQQQWHHSRSTESLYVF